MLSRSYLPFFLAVVFSWVYSGISYAQSSPITKTTIGNVSETAIGGPLAIETKPMSEASFLNSQPNKGWTLIEFAPAYSSAVRKYSNASGGPINNFEKTESAVGLKVAYGFSDSLSLSAATSVGSFDTKSSKTNRTYKFDGLSDINLDLNTNCELGSGRFYRGVQLSLSPTSDWATSVRSGSRYSGGHAIQPHISYEQNLGGGWLFGSALSYKFNGETKSEAKDRRGQVYFRENTLGGDTLSLSAFTERRLDWSAIGLVGTFNNVGGTSVSNDDEAYDLDSYRTVQLRLYGNFEVARQFSLIPELSYQSYLTREMNGIKYDTASETSIFVNTRVNL